MPAGPRHFPPEARSPLISKIAHQIIDRLLVTHAVLVNSPEDTAWRHTNSSGGIRGAHHLAVDRNHLGHTSITHLIVPSGPAAIARLVSTIIVDTFYFCALRTSAHVLIE